MSAVKTANVNARIEADIKQKAESILMQIKIPYIQIMQMKNTH